MTITPSGAISLQNLATEFGGSVPHSLSEYYREGSLVTKNNTSVPTSGAIALGHFYSAVKEIQYTASNAASLNLSTAFGADWGANKPKRLIVPAGVVLGPVTIPNGMLGTLIVENAGEIQGLGGAPNSSVGGAAITASVSFSLLNTGAVRGGGGGGGRGGLGGTGGTGGMGRVTTYSGYTNVCTTCPGGSCPTGSTRTCGAMCGKPDNGYYYKSCSPVYVYYSGGSGGAGGTGGAGGVGQGYGQANAAGSTGSAGAAGGAPSNTTYAGYGGAGGQGGLGGTGGTWGTSGGNGSVGNTGATGANGNFTNGSVGSAGASGASGGAAGAAVLMLAGTVSVTNSGTINGTY